MHSASPIPTLNPDTRFVLDREKGLWEIHTAQGEITPQPDATEVMGLIDGKRSVEEIADHMAETAGSSREEARRRVEDVVGELQGLGVLTLVAPLQ